MEYSPNKMQQNLNSHQFHFKKNYGQNFIIDRNIIEKIVTSCQIDDNTLGFFSKSGYSDDKSLKDCKLFTIDDLYK